ncbi:MAG: GDP-mannose 4,6 dehydratase [Gemmatimonas sp.]|nr:GDP-mannose 4,6 dehydratase [Gemmatimonas sp.]
MTVRALVTGAAGFVGQWTCRALLREGWEVEGVSLEGTPPRGILTAAERAAVRWEAMDLSPTSNGASRVLALFRTAAPDVIIHLAGIAFQASAAADVERAFAVNVGAATELLRAAALAKAAGEADPRVLVVGSAEQYGAHAAAEMPLPESAACRPKTVYGKTKVAQEVAALGMARETGLRVVCTRSFNHSGPGQAPSFLLPSLIQRARDARRSGQPVRIGNTDVTRDFLHVEDVVSAYISLVSRGQPGEVYNVCSGVGVRVGELAAEVLAAAGVRSPLEVDPALQRAVDVPVLVGSNAKLRAATGWTPLKSRSDIIQDLLDAAS